VLCSYAAEATEIEKESRKIGATVITVDASSVNVLPNLRTTTILDGSAFYRETDTPAKRNLGLAVTWLAGWDRVFFLDDDIEDVRADDVMRAAALLDRYDVVGLNNNGFADNSVVCHANRDTGGDQGTFIGAGAMIFRGSRATSFFPDVYNEDWFFLLDGHKLTRCAVYGSFAQARFDPYLNRDRAGTQELGDCLAEGIFALLDDGLTVDAANRPFWREFLVDRGRLIETLLKRLPAADDLPAVRREQIATALRAARTSLSKITPDLCCNYLAAWRNDRYAWRIWIEARPRGLPVDEALSYLGIKY
jgi:hypothetical protein